MRDVGSDAEVDHRPAAVDSSRCAVGDFAFDEMFLVFVVLSTS